MDYESHIMLNLFPYLDATAYDGRRFHIDDTVGMDFHLLVSLTMNDYLHQTPIPCLSAVRWLYREITVAEQFIENGVASSKSCTFLGTDKDLYT